MIKCFLKNSENYRILIYGLVLRHFLTETKVSVILPITQKFPPESPYCNPNN